MRLRHLAVCAALLAAAPAAQAQDPVPADALGGRGDQHIDYPPWTSQTNGAPAMTVAGVGDVNGDGLEDVAAGFSGSWAQDPVYVTFSSRVPVAGEALGLGGVRVLTRGFWHGIAGVGDVNGDGLGEVAIVSTDGVVVVFGRHGGAVDANNLGTDGFTITGVGQNVGHGSEIFYNNGIAPLGDVDGDGVPDMALAAGREAAIVHPPRDAAGITIDASAPGPRVSRLRATRELAVAFVDRLGDVDGDGRADVLMAGEEREGVEQVAYGVRTPAPGTLVELPAAVDAGHAFELRTRDGREGWYGELEAALTLGDQNGDGIRDVGMVGHRDRRSLRVAYTPAFGTRRDIHDLGAADARGYAMHMYSDVIDVGDQNGDGRGDLASFNFVYFTDPPRETGSSEPATRGFAFANERGTVAAPIKDLNGDGKPELAVARVNRTENGSPGNWRGENATYALDVFDSGRAPQAGLPQLPVTVPGGAVEVPVDIASGAGARGSSSIAVRPRLEVQTPEGNPVAAADGGVIPGTAAAGRVALRTPPNALVTGRTYRARYTVANGRGLSDSGPWRTFVAAAAPSPPRPVAAPAAKGVSRRGTRKGDRLTGTSYLDRLYGLSGNDVISGRAGDDLLSGGKGRDRITGGGGDGIRDVVRCGRGRDTVRADRKDRLVGCERRA